MDLRQEIATQAGKLPPEMQEQVLQFIASLGAGLPNSAPLQGNSPLPKGETGAALSQFAGSLDAASARQMIQSIEEECERVDASAW